MSGREDDFMSSLFADLDANCFDEPPSSAERPKSQPRKSKTVSTLRTASPSRPPLRALASNVGRSEEQTPKANKSPKRNLAQIKNPQQNTATTSSPSLNTPRPISSHKSIQSTSTTAFYPTPSSVRSTKPLPKTRPVDIEDVVPPTSRSIRKSPSKATSSLVKGSNEPSSEMLLTAKGKGKDENLERDIEALLDGCETWSDDGMDIDAEPAPQKAPISKRYTRCVVASLEEGQGLAFGRIQKILRVVAKPEGDKRIIVLNDDWSLTKVFPGDVVNVIGDFTLPAPSPPDSLSTPSLPTITLTYTSDSLLIVNPDTLISATSISTSASCLRKPILSEKVRSTSDITPALIWGNILHVLFQRCLKSGEWGLERRTEWARELCQKEIEGFWRLGIEVEEGISEVLERSKGFEEFRDKFVAESPKSDAYLVDPRTIKDSLSSRVAITAVHDIEEDIWSPRLGLKGKIDASVQACLDETGKGTINATFPFEVKTGRSLAVMEHRAQTMMYTLLMGDRYNEEVKSGLLYYTQSNSVVNVEAVRNEVRALLMLRNEMSTYLTTRKEDLYHPTDPEQSPSQDGPHLPTPSQISDGPSIRPTEGDSQTSQIEKSERTMLTKNKPWEVLPPPIDEERMCTRCYAVDTCMLFRKTIECTPFISADVEDPLQKLFEEKTSHLTPEHAAFFARWEGLVSLEEREMVRFKKEIWTMKAEERQKAGRCFANMIIDNEASDDVFNKFEKSGKIHQHTYRLTPNKWSASSPSSPKPSPTPSSSLLSGHISTGDPILISLEESGSSKSGILALARGFVLELKPTYVVVGVDHQIVDIPQIEKTSTSNQPPVFRVDKDELAAGMGRIRDNLAKLFYAGGDDKRRRLIVDLEPPLFLQSPSHIIANDSITPEPGRPSEFIHLNEDQHAAVDKVLTAKDYALIVGMPGTGKTTTIAEIITALARRGKSVLLTSYTHSAVDNILLKIRDRGIDILRLGNSDKILSSLSDLTSDAAATPHTLADLEAQMYKPQVVATTCLTINHAIFTKRTFDYCIVDEASQITLPACIGPLRFANTFVLVGDHDQLPPLVKNPLARDGGLDISLFKRLSDAHPDALVYLTHQYRMNSDIMMLSNRLVYGNRLVCGSEEVRDRSLSLPDRESWGKDHDSVGCTAKPCWIKDLLEPSRKVVFVDTDQLPARESRVGNLIQNEMEATILFQLAEALIACGLSPHEIGVITFYRQQIKHLSHLFRGKDGIEILTADRSQGRDKECILMSMTRSNESNQVGDLLKDWRRINVSLTRARSKLVICGSRKTLGLVLTDLFSVIEEKGWVYKLPADALEVHRSVEEAAGLSKRSAQGTDEIDDESSSDLGTPRPKKRPKTVTTSLEGILNGRPILKDVINMTEG